MQRGWIPGMRVMSLNVVHHENYCKPKVKSTKRVVCLVRTSIYGYWRHSISPSLSNYFDQYGVKLSVRNGQRLKCWDTVYTLRTFFLQTVLSSFNEVWVISFPPTTSIQTRAGIQTSSLPLWPSGVPHTELLEETSFFCLDFPAVFPPLSVFARIVWHTVCRLHSHTHHISPTISAAHLDGEVKVCAISQAFTFTKTQGLLRNCFIRANK